MLFLVRTRGRIARTTSIGSSKIRFADITNAAFINIIAALSSGWSLSLSQSARQEHQFLSRSFVRSGESAMWNLSSIVHFQTCARLTFP